MRAFNHKFTAIIITMVMLLTIVVSPIGQVYADTEIDGTAPVIKNMVISNTDNLVAGESEITVSFDLIEEGSGVNYIGMWFRIYPRDEFFVSFQKAGLLHTGHHIIKLQIPDYAYVGEYEFSEVSYNDANGNSGDIVFSSVKCDVLKIVKSSAKKYDGAFLADLTLLDDWTNIDARGTLHYRFTIISNGDKVYKIRLPYQMQRRGFEIVDVILENKEGWGTGTYDVSYPMNSIFAKDSWYSFSLPYIYNKKNAQGEGISQDNIAAHSLLIEESDRIYEKGINTPKLEKIWVEHSKVKTPAANRLYIVVDEDDRAPMDYIDVSYKYGNGNYGGVSGTPIPAKNGKKGEYYINMPISAFAGEGVMKIQELRLWAGLFANGEYDAEASYYNHRGHGSWTNTAGENIYIDSEYVLNLLRNAEITVESGYNIKYFSACGNPNNFDNISALEDGETAVLDCRNNHVAEKELFEAIAGKKVNLVLTDENMQWVFDGKKVSLSKCKDIILDSTITVADGKSLGFGHDKKVAVLKYADNGELPGKAKIRVNKQYLIQLYEFEDKLKLSHLKKNGDIVIEDDSVELAADDYYECELDHNSTFVLSKNVASALVENPIVTLSKTTYEYDGKVKSPSVTVKDGDRIFTKDEDYTVSYASGRKSVGKYKVTVNFIGDYRGKKEVFFTIVPKAPTKVTAVLNTKTGGYDDVNVSWNKATGASGYYVYYKKASAKKYTYLTRTTGISATKKDLIDGTRYFFKVVPYYKSGDTRYESLSYNTANIYTLKKLSTPKLTKNGTRVRIKWNNIDGETGYQISKSTKKSGTKIIDTIKTTTGKYKSYTAKKGVKYYYKIRAYKSVKVGSKYVKVYGPWSDAKAFRR